MADQMLDIQIVRAINAIGPLTRKQIINRINEDPINVEASLDALLTMGCLRTKMSTCFKGDFEYSLASNFTERDCKLADHRQKVSLYVARHGSESKAVIPVTSGISFSEGLDRAIWKAANVDKWLTVAEIRNTLMKVGFRKDDVVSRIQYHINSGKWFDRQSGRNKNQFFMLRNDIPCPELPGTTNALKALTVSSTTEAAAEAPVLVTASIKTPVADGYFPISSLGEDVISVAHEQARLLIRDHFTLHEAIWALMDGDEYSYSDLVTILAPFGFTGSQISPLLSKRFADGLLSRRMVLVDGRWVNVYKKNGELPQKYTSGKSVVSDIIEAQQSTEVEVIAATQEKVETLEKPQLFETVIRMKGVQISLNEFSMLYKELAEAGFVRDMHKSFGMKPGQSLRLLTTTHEVKGVTFTRDELIDLTNAMYNTATHFKMALVV